MQEIAKLLNCSVHKIKYWMDNYGIKIRTISDAVYLKHNPNGDPFKIRKPKTMEEAVLYGLGVGLYWGEGTKSNTNSIRLGNTDPRLIKKFIQFLDKIYGIDFRKLKFGLQVFSDLPAIEARKFWEKELNISPKQFQKVVVTNSGKVGTYRKKNKTGVLTIYYNNRKLRDILCKEIESIS